MKILFRDLAKRPLTEILTTDLFIIYIYNYMYIEILYRDPVMRPLIRDLVRRPGEESSDLSQRSCKRA